MSEWRKSSASALHEGCVAVRRDLRAIRDTRSPDGLFLVVDARQLVRLATTATRHHRNRDVGC